MRKPIRWFLFLAIAGASISFTILLARGVLLNQSGRATVWRFVSGQWRQTPDLQGAAFGIQVSANGLGWVATTFHAGLSRWEHDHWTWFKGEDFGTAAVGTSPAKA